ncbi:MAG: hypothetical protein QJR02_02325 [Sinobacteraceae bacterium]|nr:hypothetical protein [Nevskiaceae bacterium]
MRIRRLMIAAAALAAGTTSAAPAPFDLAGPSLVVDVQRGSAILPIDEVPALAEGDRLWISTAFSPSQTVHYLLVAAFLKGSTDPPPGDWIFPCKTWSGTCARRGLTVTVPKGARQAVIFLAPSTRGDVEAITEAVRGRPGAFVRATQELTQAALDHSRLTSYLNAIQTLGVSDSQALKKQAPLLARSLAIKFDEKCLDRIPQLQIACLTADQDNLILADAQTSSLAHTVSTGPAADLVMTAASTPQLGYGVYSPYLASVLDIVRILDSFTSAQFQYIPALATPRGNRLALALNAVPSFDSPKSVIVVALPAIEQARPPQLRPVDDPPAVACASDPHLVLPVEGAPLVFSTRYAHDMTLTLSAEGRPPIRLPAQADAAQGGFVVDTRRMQSAPAAQTYLGTLEGYWGFESYRGPSFPLQTADPGPWRLAAGDEDALVVGRTNTVHLRSRNVSCIDRIALKTAAGQTPALKWQAVKPDEVAVEVPLEDAQPGAAELLISQYGAAQPVSVPLTAYSIPAKLDRFELHAGDVVGTLRGKRLDQVASLAFAGTTFVPGTLSSASGEDQLQMTAADATAVAALAPGAAQSAVVTLKDGRSAQIPALVDAPRPQVDLIAEDRLPSSASRSSNIQLEDPHQLPQDAVLVFSVRARVPERLPRDLALEVASADESFSTRLTVADGSLRLEDSRVAVATLDAGKAFGPSAFGPLKFRPVTAAAAGDWQPLATLTRLPRLDSIRCPADPGAACLLSGTDLFLIDAVSDDPEFKRSVQVAAGFPGASLPVPRPRDGHLYLKLRDDPAVVDRVDVAHLDGGQELAAEATPAASAAPHQPPPPTPQEPPAPAAPKSDAQASGKP